VRVGVEHPRPKQPTANNQQHTTQCIIRCNSVQHVVHHVATQCEWLQQKALHPGKSGSSGCDECWCVQQCSPDCAVWQLNRQCGLRVHAVAARR
jgi:hypothetical protein